MPSPVCLGRLRLALVVTLVGLVPRLCHAQAISIYGDRVYREGPGVQLGSSPLVLHGGLVAEGGYDSNVKYSPSDEVGAWLVRARLHLDLATLSSRVVEGDRSTADPVIDFRLSAQAELRRYFTDRVDRDVDALNYQISTQARGELALFPRGPYTLRLVDTFLRTIDPGGPDQAVNFTRDYNRVGLLGSARVGALELGLSDHFAVNQYEQARVPFGNYLNNEAEAYARLRLLTQTQISLVARVGWIHYQSNPTVDGTPLRVLLGASSLFTTWLGITAAVGYGNSFSRGESYSSVIGSLDVRFLLPTAARVTLSYRRDFADSLMAHAIGDDQFGVGFDQPLLRRLTAHLDGSVRLRKYVGLIDPTLIDPTWTFSSTTRDDVIYEVHADLSVQLTPWLVAGASYGLLADSTDFAIRAGASPGAWPVKYIKHSTFVRLDLAY